MTLDEAKALLATCERDELRDHAFGDCEVYWMKGETEIASGYFGGEDAEVHIGETVFIGVAAGELRTLGMRGFVERNDSTGPDTYQEGECQPGLTLEGVQKELEGR